MQILKHYRHNFNTRWSWSVVDMQQFVINNSNIYMHIVAQEPTRMQQTINNHINNRTNIQKSNWFRYSQTTLCFVSPRDSFCRCCSWWCCSISAISAIVPGSIASRSIQRKSFPMHLIPRSSLSSTISLGSFAYLSCIVSPFNFRSFYYYYHIYHIYTIYLLWLSCLSPLLQSLYFEVTCNNN